MNSRYFNFIALIPTRSIRQMFWQFFLELNSKRMYQISGKEKESGCLVFRSSTKREIRHFHDTDSRAVTAENCPKKSDARAKLNLLLFCRPR